MTSDPEPALLQDVRRALDHAAQDLDADTLRRLRAARYHALEAARPAGQRSRRWLLPAGAGLAVAVVAAVFIWLSTPHNPPAVSAVAELDVLTAQENLDFYNDLDFYRWLAGVHDAT